MEAAAADTAAAVTPAAQAGSAMTRTPLQREWALWELRTQWKSGKMEYLGYMIKLLQFSTVEDFWVGYAAAPTLEEVFSPSGKNTARCVVERVDESGGPNIVAGVEGYMLFRSGVVPDYKAEVHGKRTTHNAFQVHLTFTSLAALQAAWEAAQLLAIGESCDPAEVLTGLCLTDERKAPNTRHKVQVHVRLELWFAVRDDDVCLAVCEEFRRALLEATGASSGSSVAGSSFVKTAYFETKHKYVKPEDYAGCLWGGLLRGQTGSEALPEVEAPLLAALRAVRAAERATAERGGGGAHAAHREEGGGGGGAGGGGSGGARVSSGRPEHRREYPPAQQAAAGAAHGAYGGGGRGEGARGGRDSGGGDGGEYNPYHHHHHSQQQHQHQREHYGQSSSHHPSQRRDSHRDQHRDQHRDAFRDSHREQPHHHHQQHHQQHGPGQYQDGGGGGGGGGGQSGRRESQQVRGAVGGSARGGNSGGGGGAPGGGGGGGSGRPSGSRETGPQVGGRSGGGAGGGGDFAAPLPPPPRVGGRAPRQAPSSASNYIDPIQARLLAESLE